MLAPPGTGNHTHVPTPRVGGAPTPRANRPGRQGALKNAAGEPSGRRGARPAAASRYAASASALAIGRLPQRLRVAKSSSRSR